MRTEPTDESVPAAGQNPPAEAGYEAAVAKIIAQLTASWRVSDKTAAPLPQTDGWFPPNRPRRGCEDC